MRVADYIAERLAKLGVKYIYGIMGGGAAGLNDAFIINEKLKYICFHHEQGAANAALGESKVTNSLSVVNPTTGCGGLNCMTSLVSAYQDSIPVLFISGNFRLQQTTRYLNREKNINLRKIGLQEHDIISNVQPSTKWSCFIENPNEVPEKLEFAIKTCLSGRKGPCWIDIPADIQGMQIEDKYLNVDDLSVDYLSNEKSINSNQLYNILLMKNILEKSEKPLVLAGYGIHLSDSQEKFLKFIDKYNIPFVTTFLSKDYVDYRHNLNIGTIGIKGSRAGNFAIHNCDYLLVLGSSLGPAHIGYNDKIFSPSSYKVFVNIDKYEKLKDNVNVDLFIDCNLRDFFDYV